MSNIQNNKISELLLQQQIQQPKPQSTPQTGKGPDFGTILQDQLKLSGHAQTRLQSRNIQLNQDEWARVVNGVNKAAAKGAKESLVMVDNVALVVSVKNRTVITAVDKDSLKDNVFTNIDSAVVV
jgi:flagellar operon protein